jgi:hypothetical protein
MIKHSLKLLIAIFILLGSISSLSFAQNKVTFEIRNRHTESSNTVYVAELWAVINGTWQVGSCNIYVIYNSTGLDYTAFDLLPAVNSNPSISSNAAGYGPIMQAELFDDGTTGYNSFVIDAAAVATYFGATNGTNGFHIADLRWTITNGSIMDNMLLDTPDYIGQTVVFDGLNVLNYNTGGTDGWAVNQPVSQQVIPSVGNTITLGAITPLSYCAGQTISVPFTTTGTWNAGNVFTAQLSNGAGDFTAPVTYSGTSPISLTIPANATTAAGYQVRVVASSPATTSNTSTVTINALQNILFTAIPTQCSNSPTFSLANYASPAGGTWSGTGVTGSSFDPSAVPFGGGTFVLTYSLGGACPTSATTSVVVNQFFQASIGTHPTTFCFSALPTQFNGLPAGGTWTGAGINNSGIFSPSTPGTYTLTYAYGVAGCSSSAQTTIVVNANPTIDMPIYGSVCINSPSFTLTGATPVGGTWSGNGVSGNSFNAASAGVGTSVLTYTVTVNGCTSSSTMSIVVNPLPLIVINPVAPVCANAAPFQLVATPAGGEWSGPGVSNTGMFTPAQETPGSYTVTYTVSVNGCTSSNWIAFMINPLPTITMPNFADVCASAPAFLLTGATPVGGTWNGTGVSANMFNPSVAGPGLHMLTYSFTDANGCTNSNTTEINVTAAPVVGLALNISTVCFNTPAYELQAVHLPVEFIVEWV